MATRVVFPQQRVAVHGQEAAQTKRRGGGGGGGKKKHVSPVLWGIMKRATDICTLLTAGDRFNKLRSTNRTR